MKSQYFSYIDYKKKFNTLRIIVNSIVKALGRVGKMNRLLLIIVILFTFLLTGCMYSTPIDEKGTETTINLNMNQDTDHMDILIHQLREDTIG